MNLFIKLYCLKIYKCVLVSSQTSDLKIFVSFRVRIEKEGLNDCFEDRDYNYKQAGKCR